MGGSDLARPKGFELGSIPPVLLARQLERRRERSRVAVPAGPARSIWYAELHLVLSSGRRVGAREAVRQAEDAQRSAATQSRIVARRLQERGLSGRDIAAVLRLSPQRVSQLLRA